jgi:HJR/Mrr/RecB family endonuclease
MAYSLYGLADIVTDIIGASYSVKILIDEKDIEIISQIYDLFLLSDQRLNLSILITHEKDGINRSSSMIENIMDDILKNGWDIYTKQTKFSANAVIIDNESIFLFYKNDKSYLIDKVDDNSTKREILYLFQNIIKDKDSNLLLFEDILFSSIRQNSEIIIKTSAEIWSETIAKLADNPVGLMELSPRKFEELVAELLIRENMHIRLTRKTKDGGIDIFAEVDTILGRHLYLVECKRYAKTNPVGVSIVRSLYGVVESQNATKGIIITTSNFTRGSKTFSDSHKNRMDLKNYDSLVNWLKKIKKS